MTIKGDSPKDHGTAPAVPGKHETVPTKEEVASSVRLYIAQITKRVSNNTISDNVWMLELGLDSVLIFDLVIAIEEKFDISLSDDELGRAVTVGNIIELVAAKAAKAGGSGAPPR